MENGLGRWKGGIYTTYHAHRLMSNIILQNDIIVQLCELLIDPYDECVFKLKSGRKKWKKRDLCANKYINK